MLTFSSFVPESPRWLLQHGRIEEAKEILTKMAEFNKKPIPDYSHLETYVQVIICVILNLD